MVRGWETGELLNSIVETRKGPVPSAPHVTIPLRRTMRFEGKGWASPSFSGRLCDNVFNLTLLDSGEVIGAGSNQNGRFTVSGILSKTGDVFCDVKNRHGVWPISVKWNPADSTLIGSGLDDHQGQTRIVLKATYASGPRVFTQSSLLYGTTVLKSHKTFHQVGIPANAVLTLVEHDFQDE